MGFAMSFESNAAPDLATLRQLSVETLIDVMRKAGAPTNREAATHLFENFELVREVLPGEAWHIAAEILRTLSPWH